MEWHPVVAEAEPVVDISAQTLGVNGEADRVTRLVSAAEATLLTRDASGGSHRIKLNKATADDTASIMFQTGYGGRAEIDLAGTDALSIKTSADGAIWSEALSVDPQSGAATVSRLTMTGSDGVDNYLRRAGDYSLRKRSGLSSFDFLLTGVSTTISPVPSMPTTTTRGWSSDGSMGVCSASRCGSIR